MAKGRDSSVKAKLNANYGGAATFPTTGMYEIPFTAEGFKKIVERDRSQNISSGRSYASRFTKGKKWVGKLTGNAIYSRMDHMIASIMGLPTTATTDTTAQTNTYTPLTTAMPVIDWEVNKGNIPTGKAFNFLSGIGKSLEVSWNDRGAVSYAYECVGYDEVSTATTGTTAATSDVALVKDLITVGSQMTVLDIGTGASGAYCIKSGKIKLEQPITEDDYCNGSDTMARPDADDFLNVTGEFTIKFADRGVYEDFVAQNDMVADIKFVSTLTITGAASTKRSVEFFINKLNYTSDDGGLVLVDKPGLLLAKVGWEAYGIGGSTTSSEPIAIKTVSEVKGDTAL